MKKIIIICFLLATTFTVNAQSKSSFDSVSGFNALLGETIDKTEIYLNKNNFVRDDKYALLYKKNDLTIITFNLNSKDEASELITVLKNDIIVGVVVYIIESNSANSSTIFNDKIKNFKNSLIKNQFNFIKKTNESDGSEKEYFHNEEKKQKALICNFDSFRSSLNIYSEAIDIEKFQP